MAGGNPKNKLSPKKQLHVGKTLPKKNGRPTKYNEESVKKLLDVFKLGGSVEEATSYAGVSRQAYYEWLERHPSLVTEVEQAKMYPIIVARNIVVESMQRNRDISTAKWYLEKTAFRNTTNHGGEGVSNSNTPQVNIVFPDLVKQRYEQAVEGEIIDDQKPERNELIVSSGATEDLPIKE